MSFSQFRIYVNWKMIHEEITNEAHAKLTEFMDQLVYEFVAQARKRNYFREEGRICYRNKHALEFIQESNNAPPHIFGHIMRVSHQAIGWQTSLHVLQPYVLGLAMSEGNFAIADTIQ